MQLPEWLRILRLLLHKHYLVRKRQWQRYFFLEVLLPVGIFFMLWLVRNMESHSINEESTDCERQHIEQLLIEMIEQFESYQPRILYAPKTDFTTALMDNIGSRFYSEFKVLGYESESELLKGYHIFDAIETDWNAPTVIFDESSLTNATKHLKYTIRSKKLHEKSLYNVFAVTNVSTRKFFTEDNFFIQLQLCLDLAFIHMGSNYFEIIFMKRIPRPMHVIHNPNDEVYRDYLKHCFLFVLISAMFYEMEISFAEKILGVNVLMSMNGVSNLLNILSWIVSGSICITTFNILPVVLMLQSAGGTNAVPYLYYGNTIVVFLAFILHGIHLICYGIHLSAYFDGWVSVIFAVLLAAYLKDALELIFKTAETLFLAPYFGVIFPSFLIERVFDEIDYYELTGEGVLWKTIFDVGNEKYGTAGSIGGILICSVVGIIVHFTLAVYVYTIHPGKYGAPQHPLYFLQGFLFRDSKVDNDYRMDNLEGVDEKFFEPEDGMNYEPGIQIRGLRKIFNLGSFSKKIKVAALHDIWIDFYKGQITVLLGPNGAGKTTLMSILAGMQAPSDGVVLINSKDMKVHSREIMNDMGLCTQENMLFPFLTVGEQLEFFAMLKGEGKEKSVIQQNVTNLLLKFDLLDKADTLPEELSGGQKRRVCLGMALVGDSSILILDEPTSGLDPENRRIVWDALLKLRHEKTILISTHDLEEADVLGDRIAIIFEGQMRSYGSPMYLKKSIGGNNVQVTLSLEPSNDLEAILAEFDSSAQITSQNVSKVVINVPNTPELPDSLDSVESKKEELGITGLSVSLTSLEQVFLNVTQGDDSMARSREALSSMPDKLTGNKLLVHSIKALLYKKMAYTRKNMSAIYWMLILVIIMLICVSFVLKVPEIQEPSSKLIPLSLDMYDNPITFVQAFNVTYSNAYARSTQQFGGHVVHVDDLDEALMDYAKSNYTHYKNHLIAAAEYEKSDYSRFIYTTIVYSNKAFYSYPISVNLAMNTLLKAKRGNDYSISVSSQLIPTLDNLIHLYTSEIATYSTALLIAFVFCPSISLFVIHPSRESTTSVKQLQTMTAGSCFGYWGTMFLFDMAVYLILIVFILVGFAWMDTAMDLKIFMYGGMWYYFLLYLLFATSSLPFVYLFSFSKKEPRERVTTLIYTSVYLLIFEIVMQTVRLIPDQDMFFRLLCNVQRALCLFTPYISFFYGQLSYFRTAQTNARCLRIPDDFYIYKCSSTLTDPCCHNGCRGGKCIFYLTYFNELKDQVNLKDSLLYLGFTSILYFGMIFAIEYQWIQMLRMRIKMLRTIIPYVPGPISDEQVRKSKSDIAMRINNIHNHDTNYSGEFNGSSVTNEQNSVQFMVYELRKRYDDLEAVKDVSFAVNQMECFGLLGVNGAGKTTTFRMMTGAEFPDGGIMYMGDKDFKNHKLYFLSQIGYCPQQDAIIMSLNAYDHLRLFARLRGIPEERVESEVNKWIERLNLTSCASKPSNTYSGGNKRRLNIAIALIGIPNILLLDEPTSGLDPGARRSLWNIIQAYQMMGMSVVLTSQSMDECEELCNRLTIMVDGRMVCIGSSQELKQRFGAGYDIKVKLNPEKVAEQIDDLKADMIQELQCEIIDENVGHIMFHVEPNDDMSWRKMYDAMNAMKDKYDCIDDFSVVSATLERLFLLFARADNYQSPPENDQ